MMKIPPIVWECEYKHDRREHRHKCRCCRRNINAGENVLMVKRSKGSFAIHALCSSVIHSPGTNWTYRDFFEALGTEYLISVGYKIAPHPMSFAP